jgi:AP-2 complex subunit beta-1
MSTQASQDAKFFTRGKIEVRAKYYNLECYSDKNQEFRAELQAAESKDKKFLKRKTVLKKIVANITMGNDSTSLKPLPLVDKRIKHLYLVSPLFTDVAQCLGTPLLEIKKSMPNLIRLSRPCHLSIFLVVYLFLVSYGRSKPDQIHIVIPNFLQVRRPLREHYGPGLTLRRIAMIATLSFGL